MKKVILTLAFAFLIPLAINQIYGQTSSEFVTAIIPSAVTGSSDIPTQIVNVNLDALKRPSMNLTIFGETIPITHEKTITRNATDFTYIGSTQNSSHNVFIAVLGDQARLELDAPNKNIVLEHNGQNHVIRDTNDVAFGPENEGGGQFSLNPNYQQIVNDILQGEFTSVTHHNLEIDVIL